MSQAVAGDGHRVGLPQTILVPQPPVIGLPVSVLGRILTKEHPVETFLPPATYLGSKGRLSVCWPVRRSCDTVAPSVIWLDDQCTRADSSRASSIPHRKTRTHELAASVGLRSFVETGMNRYKTIVSRRLHTQNLPNQKTEAKGGSAVLSRMTMLGMPCSARIR